ncbi:hypothetical protein ACHQM5_005501 [Ranunculus cassubicifolius]
MAVIGLYFDPFLVLETGKKKVRSLFWKVRAELRRRQKHRCCSFQYDPFSYSLNFDNGESGFFC